MQVSPPTPTWLQLLDALDKGVKIVAVFAAAIWAYYRFVRGRTFRDRLEPSISGEVLVDKGSKYIIASASARNVGSSVVRFKQGDSGVRIWAANESLPRKRGWFSDDFWTRIDTVPVFAKHYWIEPGEIISDKMLVEVPRDACAIRVDFRIVGKK